MTESFSLRPSSRLIQHDVRFELRPDGRRVKLRVVIDCQRTGTARTVDDCRGCERFARIEAHEAGYILLCRALDEPFENTED